MKKYICSIFYLYEVLVGAILATIPTVHILLLSSSSEPRKVSLQKIWIDSVFKGFKFAQQGVKPW